MTKDIRDLSLDELRAEIAAMGEKPHRARQIFKWLNDKGSEKFEAMTNLPKELISELNKKFSISNLTCLERLVSKDGTEKFLWGMDDGEKVETVVIKGKSRTTYCLSTQVGCKFGCPFCASGERGFSRDLRVAEIIGQVISARRISGIPPTNLVFMGMGEPLDNYDNLIKAIRVINHPDGMRLGARKMTVSTCGVVPGILRLADELIQVELSISLHSADDRVRDRLVPINRKYGIDELLKSCMIYHSKTGRIITIEYILLKGENASSGDAESLARVLKNIRAKVNLIPYNPAHGGADSLAPKREDVERFKQILEARGVKVTVRQSKGTDIRAACGQLAAWSTGKPGSREI